ncbi:MAG: SDR family oxidoreductase [Actinomycetota bacterium]|nr:SDR family NAD(P)-dependent oxidoreductase [Actinomycetota bacterium]
MGSLDNKVAIVTGAGRGIGREHSIALAGAGARVVVNDLGGSAAGEGQDSAPAQQVADEIKELGGQATANFDNVADFQGAENLIKQAVGEFGRLDVLVNNAGIIRDRMLVNLSEDEWDSVINVHLKGHYAPTRHAAAYWRQESKAGNPVSGRVINTSSPSGVFGNVGQTNYGAAKAGIAAFTVIAALELGRYGVTVNCLAPNARTRLTEQTFGDIPVPEGGFDAMDPANISPIIVGLASDEAANITGQCFFVYGGVVNVLKPWDMGISLSKDSRWEPEEFVSKLKEALPDGIQPEGMIPMMIKAAGDQGLQLG